MNLQGPWALAEALDKQQAFLGGPFWLRPRHRLRWFCTSHTLVCRECHYKKRIEKWVQALKLIHGPLLATYLGVPWRSLNKFLRSLVERELTCSLSSTTDWRPSLLSWRWKIFSSTVPVARKRYVKHLFFCPSRQQRAAACLSTAGFQSGSKSTSLGVQVNECWLLVTWKMCDEDQLTYCLQSSSNRTLQLWNSTEKLPSWM